MMGCRFNMNEPLHIISLMAAAGEITPMPHAAIFADTQDEPASVYRWLDWLEPRLSFPVHRVTAGKLSEKALAPKMSKDGRRYTQTSIPYFTKDLYSGEKGKIPYRICTADFKLDPLMKKARELGEVKRGEKTIRVIQWIGISLDEVSRMKPSREKWAQSRWPLIEKEMRRNDCLTWMKVRGFPEPPRSACVFCPYHSNSEWRRLRDSEPVQFEKAVQRAKAHSQNIRSQVFLHRSCVPLDQVDLSTDNERGQGILAGFNAECEGMCGV